MSNPSNRASMRGQLTLRGVVIGVLGCVIITASSAYTALKMGALPWPIVFAAVISLFFLKLMGNASLNEANVTHTIMSAGAMVAGGLAFTIRALDAGLCRPDQLARHVYRGTRRHYPGPAGHGTHPPSLYRGRRA